VRHKAVDDWVGTALNERQQVGS